MLCWIFSFYHVSLLHLFYGHLQFVPSSHIVCVCQYVKYTFALHYSNLHILIFFCRLMSGSFQNIVEMGFERKQLVESLQNRIQNEVVSWTKTRANQLFCRIRKLTWPSFCRELLHIICSRTISSALPVAILVRGCGNNGAFCFCQINYQLIIRMLLLSFKGVT